MPCSCCREQKLPVFFNNIVNFLTQMPISFIRLSSFLFFLLIFAFCSVRMVEAAPPVPVQAYAEPVLSWKDPLAIQLRADENFCRKYRNTEGLFGCYSFVDEIGTPVSGISMQPPVSGTWRWNYGNRLVFDPDHPLTLGVNYTLDLEKFSLAGYGARLMGPTDGTGRKILRIPTIPLAATVTNFEVLIDPAPKGTHLVSATVNFSWSVLPSEIEPNVVLHSAGKGMTLGRTTFVWNQDRDEVTITAPILTFAQDTTPAEVVIKGMPYWQKNAEIVADATRSGSGGNVTGRVLVPGKNGLFQVRRMELISGRNASLDHEYWLEIETTLRVMPENMEKALQVIVLPKKNQPRPGRPEHSETGRSYDWQHAPVISAQDLNKGKRLTPVSLNPPRSLNNRFRFRITPPVGSYVFAALPAGFSSPEGYPLVQTKYGVFKTISPEPELDFLQPGHVLPLSGTDKIALMASGLDSIKWEVHRIRDPFLALVAADSENFSESFSLDTTTEALAGEMRLLNSTLGQANFVNLDLKQSWTQGLLSVQLTGIRDGKKVAHASRLVLATDIGMFVKKSSDGRRNVFVCALSTGKPLLGATVRVLGRNGTTVAESHSDAEGKATLPSLEGLSGASTPTALLVLRRPEEKDFAWLSLTDASRIVDYSSFPIAGRSAAADGLTAYVFSQRGMFLPGETLLFGCLVRRGDWRKLPDQLPLLAKLCDPLGQTLMEKRITFDSDGLNEIAWKLPQNALTGRYRLDLSIGGEHGQIIGSGTVRVEEFQPDTMAMNLAVVSGKEKTAENGWIVTSDKDQAKVLVRLHNLHGMPAQNRLIRSSLKVEKTALSFLGYSQYIFHDAAPWQGTALEENLPETHTDNAGQAIVDLPFAKYQAGTMRARVLVEGFEPSGGRAVSQEKSVLLSPLPFILGYCQQGDSTNLSYIPQGRQASLEFLALNPQLERTDPGQITFTLFTRRTVQSLVKDSRGLWKYDQSPLDSPLNQSTLSFDSNKHLIWRLPTEQPGDYLLSVTSSANAVLAEIPFSVIGQSVRAPQDLDSLATGTLRLRLDKTEYAAGETIKIALTTPYAGYGLLTLERDGVAAHRWFRAQAGESEHQIAIPANFEGRAYVNAALIRAWDSPDIYMEPLSHAVVPLTVAMDRRDLGLKLEAPAKAKPGEMIEIRLTSRERGRALLFAVDEGVLQLTNFQTPRPLNNLLLDRSLDVETRQILDQLMPDQARLAGRLPSFGGDMATRGGRFHNPFKRKGEPPLATWSSLIDVVPGGTTLRVSIPDYYNGQVRLMAVGASANSAGSAEKSLTVRGPLILNPQIPLAVAPGDRFETVVGISNNSPESGKVFKLTVRTEGEITLDQNDEKLSRENEHLFTIAPIEIKAGDENFVRFMLQATDEPGEARLFFRVEPMDQNPQKLAVTRRASLSVRPATPFRMSSQSGIAQNGEVRVRPERDRYVFQRSDHFEASQLPLPLIRGLVRNLDTYPHGCTEQLLSRAFPYLLLSSRPDLLSDPARDAATITKEGDALIEAALQSLASSFQAGRGVALWAEGTPNDTLTVYAGDFLLALREAGKAVSPSLEQGIFEAIERFAWRSPTSLQDARIKAYALWVLTRDGRITTQALEQMRNSLKEIFANTDEGENDVVYTLMAGSYALMRADKLADSLVSESPESKADSFSSGDLLSPDAAMALHCAVLARSFPSLINPENLSQLFSITQRGSCPFTTAQAIRALLEVPIDDQNEEDDVQITCEDQPNTEGVMTDIAGLYELETAECNNFVMTSPQDQQWYWLLTSSGYDKTPPNLPEKQGMEINTIWTTAEGKPLPKTESGVLQVGLGDIVLAQISAQAHGRAMPNAAITMLLPGGFEIEMPQKGKAVVSGDKVIHAERREDRLLLYANLDTKSQTWKCRLRATTRGQFILPAIQAEAMYDPNYSAHTATSMIEIK